MKANAKLVGEVIASQTALATGEVDILVGGGEWVTAGLAKENPALDFSIPKEGAVLWSQSLAMFKDSKNKDLALKFIQYIMSPEGQARLATSSCYWGMPANTKAALTDEQKKILRFDEQPDFLAARAALSGARTPISTRRCRTSGRRCCRRSNRSRRERRRRTASAALGAGHAGARSGRCSSSCCPSSPWACVSLTRMRTAAATLANYAQFFANPSYLPGDGQFAAR